MLKISRLTDYGLLAAVYLARKSGEVVSAREIAAFYHLPLPMITKVLKTLHQGDVIHIVSTAGSVLQDAVVTSATGAAVVTTAVAT